MGIKKFEITEKESKYFLKQTNNNYYENNKDEIPNKVERIYQCLYFLSINIHIDEIADSTNFSRRTIYNYINKYKENKNFMHEYEEKLFLKTNKKLDDILDDIRLLLEKETVKSKASFKRLIENEFKINISRSDIKYLFYKMQIYKSKKYNKLYPYQSKKWQLRKYFKVNKEPSLINQIEEIINYLDINYGESRDYIIDGLKNKYPDLTDLSPKVLWGYIKKYTELF